MSEKPRKSKRRKAGRPTSEERETIRDKMFRYFRQGRSNGHIVNKEGFDYETVKRYREEFMKFYIDSDGKTPAQIDQEERARIGVMLEELRDHTYDVFDLADWHIKKNMNNGKPVDRYFLDLKMRAVESLRKLALDYRSLALVPRYDSLVAEVRKNKKL